MKISDRMFENLSEEYHESLAFMGYSWWEKTHWKMRHLIALSLYKITL